MVGSGARISEQALEEIRTAGTITDACLESPRMLLDMSGEADPERIMSCFR